MAELGQFLQEKREEKGWGLDEVQTRTKIQKRYLLAIEEGRYDDLPGAFYARAFIKSYAEALELEPEEVFSEFEHDLPKPRKESVDLPTRTERSKTKRSSQEGTKKNSVLPSVLVVCFLVAIVAVIWVSNIDGGGGDLASDEEENGNVDIVNETADEEETTQETNGNEENGNDNEGSGNNGESENGQLSFEEITDGYNSIYTIDSDTLEITLDFDEEADSYVDFREEPNDDDSIVETAAAPSDESEQDFDFSEHDSITVNAGYTPALTIYVNGEALEYELDPSERDFQRITIEKENESQ
ncbi:helix-turn-helix domain-containing protein [Salicibibacter halophilus]|uniref:Helix-turn-helix domain-containing protein n=1 Tax=Salicibibacter halophilus TaxID=2502791 RepID=A0A514LEA8_9BACI|nr:helix-turn-helix domain-containing protein [Salicibibacter halophilus]QDI90186.1 helix-turn-helix domain-containing protein [Salicibibacter halophilus]